MRLNWQGHGRIVYGNYYMEWSLVSATGSMMYTIFSQVSGRKILEIQVYNSGQMSDYFKLDRFWGRRVPRPLGED